MYDIGIFTLLIPTLQINILMVSLISGTTIGLVEPELKIGKLYLHCWKECYLIIQLAYVYSN